MWVITEALSNECAFFAQFISETVTQVDPLILLLTGVNWLQPSDAPVW